jgi:hypothetical protein
VTATTAAPARQDGWYLLIHQIPPRPLYLRAKVRNRLAQVGAIALKNSVYVLPRREDCLEDLQWIAQEAVSGGGEAYICQGEFVGGVSHEVLAGRFRGQAEAAYAALAEELRPALAAQRRGGAAESDPAIRSRLRERFTQLAAIDFFGARGRREVETMLKALEGRPKQRGGRGHASRAELVGRTWVTRRDPKVDRLASAWLIRRFVDPGARFRFIDAAREVPRADEIGFDMPNGTFSHEADRCTFETLIGRLDLPADAALRSIAELVHDVDLKDGKYARPETEGLRRLIAGLVRSQPGDEARLERGLMLFDDLYAAFGGAATASGRVTGRPAGPARRRVRRGR